jgi:putative transposase
MLTQEQLAQFYRAKEIPEPTQAVIERVRNSPPARRVRAGRGNVIVHYPSIKMGVTIQAESHTVELAFLLDAEIDPSIYEYYDQPPSFVVHYADDKGRNRGHWHTADYFVLGEHFCGWVECKPETKLEQLTEKSPKRYLRDEHGKWRCPPGEAYAQQYGLSYRVFSSAEIDWVFQTNIEYLTDYLMFPDRLNIDEKVAQTIFTLVERTPGISLAALLEDANEMMQETTADARAIETKEAATGNEIGNTNVADAVHIMIVINRIYADLHAVRFAEPYHVSLFCNIKAAEIYAMRQDAQKSDKLDPFSPLASLAGPVNIAPGEQLDWDGVTYRIVHLGHNNVMLCSLDHAGIGSNNGYEAGNTHDGLVELPNAVLIKLIDEGKVTQRRPAAEFAEPLYTNPYLQEIRARASLRDQAQANRRFQAVYPLLFGAVTFEDDVDSCPANDDKPSVKRQKSSDVVVPQRTLRSWKAKYRAGAHEYNSGFDALIDRRWRKGNRNPKLPGDTLDLLHRYIAEEYESKEQPPMREVHAKYCRECERLGIPAASFETFREHVKARPKHQQETKRKGHKAAYRYEPIHLAPSYTMPRQGTHPYHVVYLDHTQSDLELVNAETGESMGRPWLSIAHAGYTRMVLAFVLSYDRPNSTTCMLLIREMVRRHKRMPQVIVVDGGKEFHSTEFDVLLARYYCAKKTRPPAKPRFGSVIERVFGQANTEFFHALQGNTQLMRHARQVAKSHNPKGHAIWNLEALYQALSEYFYTIHPNLYSPGLGQSPREALQQGLLLTGLREHTHVKYDDSFLKQTMPTTSKGTAKVQINGIKINYLYYSCDAFRQPGVLGSQVPIRYDPHNIGVAYAYVRGAWMQCISDYYHIFVDHSEREIRLLTQALRERNQQYGRHSEINSKRLAEFLESVQGKEAVLAQRKKDMELGPILRHLNKQIGLPYLPMIGGDHPDNIHSISGDENTRTASMEAANGGGRDTSTTASNRTGSNSNDQQLESGAEGTGPGGDSLQPDPINLNITIYEDL